MTPALNGISTELYGNIYFYDSSSGFYIWITTGPAGSPHGAALVCSGWCFTEAWRCRCPKQPPQPGPSVPAGSRRVRLVGSSGRCAGRVEVYSGGSWSSVCQEGWDLQDAAVVCRELGCGRALEAPSSARFGGERECGRGVGAGAVCSGQWRAAPEQGPAERGPRRCRARLSSLRAAGSGELRLVGGGGRCAGRVEVKHDGEWGSVWDMEDAEVVCQQLGCGSAAGAYSARERFGKGDGPVCVARVNCDGSDAALWECGIGGWGPYKVDLHDWDAAVVCQGFSRLVGGAGACAGQLEVRQRQAWVGVCEDQVDMKAAQVVCRELGCGEPLAMAGSGRFGAASASLWDGGFQCNGTEPLLSACARRPAPSQGCSGRASIICSRKCREHRGLLGSVQSDSGNFTGRLRLVEGETRCDGWLEVPTSTGEWRRVPGELLLIRNFSSVCRELGCGELEKSDGVPGTFFVDEVNETESDIVYSVITTIKGMTNNLTHGGNSRYESYPSLMTTAPAGFPHGVSIVCSGGCPEKGQRFPCPKQPSPARSFRARRQPAGEAGGELRALCRARGGLFRWQLEQRVPGRLGPAGRCRCVPGAGLWQGPGGPELGALRWRHGAAVAVHGRVLRERGVSLGMRALGRARVRARRRGRGRVLRSVAGSP
uniref:SRCR domain-containing protein n=1 Tax=Catharus ustulatus TaxID=91951 RepID=A0A8C3VFW8_CATUS